MRILCTAIYRSNHADRHLNLLAAAGFETHVAILYKSDDSRDPLHPAVHVHQWSGEHSENDGWDQQPVSHPLPPGLEWGPLLSIAGQAGQAFRSSPSQALPWIVSVIEGVMPDILHSFSIHQTSFLVLAARTRCHKPFPFWIVSNWGCDIHFFRDQPGYEPLIAATLQVADGYFAECARDVGLARQLGFRGTTLGIQPIGGGFDLPWFRALRSPGPTSGRRLVLIKGYQGLVGRGNVALLALRDIVEQVRGYRFVLYGLNAEIIDTLDELERDCGLTVERLPFLPYDGLMRQHGKARCSIGLGVSDGICTSAIEAMLMGSVPIQSDTSCLGEWAGNQSVLLVPPEDPAALAATLLRVLSDDAFVDFASGFNDKVLDERFAEVRVNPRIIAMYQRAGALARGAA